MKIVITVDVGHPPRRPAQVECQLEESLSQVRNSSTLCIMKIIHGRSGTTKETVRNWAHNKRRRIRGIIYGENYSIFNGSTQEMRNEAGQFPDADLEASNDGITILWVK
ncbi:MAG: hypothetical protein Q8K98_10645 [Bacteroidota bacterium]|nr:hypothetical protein [Bacteroidota bacterium]